MKFGDPPDDLTDGLLRGDVVQPMEDDPTAGLPPDLARLLRDPSIIVPQDAAVFEMVARYADAPSDTMSAWGVDEWRDAWIAASKRGNRWRRNYQLLLESMLTIQGQIKDLFAGAVQVVNEIDAALQTEADPPPALSVYIDGHCFVGHGVKPQMTGAEICNLAIPVIPAEHDLFEDREGNEDRLILRDETITITPGKRFFTVPKIINAG